MPLSPIPSTLPTSTYEHLVLEALGEIAVGSTINYNPPILDTALFRHLVLNALQYIATHGGGGGGGVTSFSAGTTGLTPSASTTGAITLAGTLAVANGGTGVTTSSGVNSVVLRDANNNISANAFFNNLATIAASGTQVVLTAASAPVSLVTGSGGQTIKLPNATTLPKGTIFSFNNNQSSGAILVNNNSNTLVVSIPSGGYVTVVLLDNATAAGTWDRHDQSPSNVSWSTNTLDYNGSITNATWNGNNVAYNRGGTGQSSPFVAGGIAYGSTTSALGVTPIGTVGQVLTSAGAGTPTWTTPATGTVTSVTATAPLTSSGGATPIISTSMATNKLLGRSTAAIGVAEEISIGTGLSLSAGTLTATPAGTLPVANGGTGRTVGNYSIYGLEIHVGKDGNDTTGDGTLINPVLTITKALTLVAAGRNTVIVHPGEYNESPTVTSTNTTIATSELTGANTLLTGTLTLNAAARVSGLKMANLTITGSGNAYISNCTVDTRVIKSGSNYVEIINSELQCTAGVQITGAGTVSIVGNKCWAVAVSNAAANVLIKDCFQVLTPSVTAGRLQFDGCAIFAAAPTTNAVTASAGTNITLANSFVLNSAGTSVERVSLLGSYSILNLVYDKANSTLTGTNLNAVDYFSVINAEKIGVNTVADATVGLKLDSTGVKFNDGTIQTTAATGSGTVTSVTGTSPIASSGGVTPAISISDAAADGTTKGAATFTASDFNATSGVVSIDYTNGQAASGSTKGFLTSTDWTTFNNKGSGTVTSVSGTLPISSSGGASPTISIAAASTTVSGAVQLTDSTSSTSTTTAATPNSVKSAYDLANGKAGTAQANTFSQPQIITGTSASAMLRVTQEGSGEALRVEDSPNPDATPFVVSSAGKVGVGIAPDATVGLSVDSTGIKFSDGSIQTVAAGSADFANYLASIGQSSSIIETIERNSTNSTQSLTSGNINLIFFTPVVNTTINQLSLCVSAAATTCSVFRMGLYSYNESTNLATLIAQTANVPSSATSVQFVTLPFSPAQSVTLMAGTRYGFAFISVFTGSPQVIGISTSTLLAQQTPIMSRNLAGQTDLTATVTPTSIINVRFYMRGSFL